LVLLQKKSNSLLQRLYIIQLLMIMYYFAGRAP